MELCVQRYDIFSVFANFVVFLLKIVYLLDLLNDGEVGFHPIKGVQFGFRQPAESVVLAHSESGHALLA